MNGAGGNVAQNYQNMMRMNGVANGNPQDLKRQAMNNQGRYVALQPASLSCRFTYPSIPQQSWPKLDEYEHDQAGNDVCGANAERRLWHGHQRTATPITRVCRQRSIPK